MDGGKGREAKAVTETKQIHWWGKGGHVYGWVAFTQRDKNILTGIWAELKPETMHSICVQTHCVMGFFFIILHMGKRQCTFKDKSEWMRKCRLAWGYDLTLWLHGTLSPTIKIKSWHYCFWLPFFISIGPWMQHNSPTLGPGLLMETSPHFSPMRPLAMGRKWGIREGRGVCVLACVCVLTG